MKEAARTRRSAAAVLALVAGAAIVLLTLGRDIVEPDAPPLAPSGAFELWLADVLRNLLLFAPLGVGLAWLRFRLGAALLVGVALSAGVELVQLAIPGRMAAPIDIVANGVGTGLGHVAFRVLPGWVRPARAAERRLVVGAGLGAALVFVATGWLFEPSPADELFGHYTENFPSRPKYGGEVVTATLNGRDLPRGSYADFAPFAETLRGDVDLELGVVVGPRPERQTPVLLVTQDHGLHSFEVGVAGDDLVLRFRTRGKLVGFEEARVRLPAALRDAKPDELVGVRVERAGGDVCMTVDGERTCGLGLRVGDGWQLLVADVPAFAFYRPLLGAAWVALVCVPLGYWARLDPASALALALAAAGLLFAPAAGNLLPTPISHVVGAALGVLAGSGLRAAVPS